MAAPDFDDEDTHDRFWVFGCEEYERALTGQYEAMIEKLREQIAAATSDDQKKALEEKIAEVEGEFRRKLENVGRSVF